MRQPRQMVFQKPERRRVLRLLIFAALLAGTASCARERGPHEPIRVDLEPDDVSPKSILISRFTRDDLRAFARMRAVEEWQQVLHVSVGDLATDNPPVAGRYELTGSDVRFTPMLPLEAGRSYVLRFDPGSRSRGVTRHLIRPRARPAAEPVRVTQVFPALDEVPENLLRLYIHFSGPMAREGGVPHVKILDQQGAEVVDPFLPVEGEFWSPDYTRYTLFFDPGRVKTGILPNDRMGRPLRRGQRYSLVVSRDWKDASGKPLAEEFRRSFTVGPAIAKPLVPAAWTIIAPRAGSREPFRVTFPWRLDRALLERALGVARDGRPLTGDSLAVAGEREWRFTPAQPWAATAHQLVVLSILEDPSGNRIGRAFEVEGATRGPAGPERVLIPWSPIR